MKKAIIVVSCIVFVLANILFLSFCTGEAGPQGADGKDGADGIGIEKAELNADGELILTYSNGNFVNLGKITGENGESGEKGERGEAGKNGNDGLTPYIKNGTWWIGDKDTSIKVGVEEEKNKTFFFASEENITDYSKVFSEFKTSLKKGIVASVNLRPEESFSRLQFGLGNFDNITSASFYIELNRETLVIRANGKDPFSVAHGLQIGNNLSVIIENTKDNGKINIVSNGDSFTYETPFVLTELSSPIINIDGSAKWLDFTIGCKDYTCPIWMFGDSFFTNDSYRWIYYLYRDGYDKNCLIDAYAGERSISALESFKTNLLHGTPEYAVWCMGMNDGDVNNEVNPVWIEKANEFISICEENNIIPILATIPSTPTVCNIYKNEWIRSSNYRYIDFASAVQDESDTDWYDGLLYSDNVHPTDKGALTLYCKFINDFPEITQN